MGPRQLLTLVAVRVVKVEGGGGGSNFCFRLLGAFLNSLLHSEHFKYTQMG